MTHPSVTIRRKLAGVRTSVGILKSQEGITAEDELNISNIYRMIAQIDERHRHRLNLSGQTIIPLRRRALAADCLTAAERRALANRIRNGEHHDPAA